MRRRIRDDLHTNRRLALHLDVDLVHKPARREADIALELSLGLVLGILESLSHTNGNRRAIRRVEPLDHLMLNVRNLQHMKRAARILFRVAGRFLERRIGRRRTIEGN